MTRIELALFNLEIKKKRWSSIDLDIHHSKVFSSELESLALWISRSPLFIYLQINLILHINNRKLSKIQPIRVSIAETKQPIRRNLARNPLELLSLVGTQHWYSKESRKSLHGYLELEQEFSALSRQCFVPVIFRICNLYYIHKNF